MPRLFGLTSAPMPDFSEWLGKVLCNDQASEVKTDFWYMGADYCLKEVLVNKTWHASIWYRDLGDVGILSGRGQSSDRASARTLAEAEIRQRTSKVVEAAKAWGLLDPDPEVAALQALLVQAHTVLVRVGDDDHLQTDDTLEAAAEVWSSIERHEPKIPGLTS